MLLLLPGCATGTANGVARAKCGSSPRLGPSQDRGLLSRAPVPGSAQPAACPPLGPPPPLPRPAGLGCPHPHLPCSLVHPRVSAHEAIVFWLLLSGSRARLALTSCLEGGTGLTAGGSPTAAAFEGWICARVLGGLSCAAAHSPARQSRAPPSQLGEASLAQGVVTRGGVAWTRGSASACLRTDHSEGPSRACHLQGRGGTVASIQGSHPRE